MTNDVSNAFSQKELMMVSKIDSVFLNTVINTVKNYSPIVVFNALASICFIENKQGPAVESLRRCLRACEKGYPKRLTKEYDNLIIL